jgi:hypothetical protein
MADWWRRCPNCKKARPERELQAYKRYGSCRWGTVLLSGFRCPDCGHLGDGWDFRFAKAETGARRRPDDGEPYSPCKVCEPSDTAAAAGTDPENAL